MSNPKPRRAMTLKDVRLLIDKSVSAWVDDYAPSMGAAIAYYTLFSMAPLLILLVALSGLFFGAEAARGEIVAQLQGRIGPEAAAVVQDVLKTLSQPAQSVVASVVGTIVLLFGATSVFGELQSALNRIWRVPEPATASLFRTQLRGRLLSFAMLLAIGLFLSVSLAFGTALSAVEAWSDQWFGGSRPILHIVYPLVSFVTNIGIFAMLFKFIPRARVAWRDVFVGALVTALLYEGGRILIGLYLGRSTVGSGFGAAGSVVIFLVWVYYSAQVFLLGAEFTWVYAHQRGSRAERFETKQVPLVPSRSGEATAEEKAARTREAPPSYPLTQRSVTAAGSVIKKGAVGLGKVVRQKPLVGVGLMAGFGLGLALVLRRSASQRDRGRESDRDHPRLADHPD